MRIFRWAICISVLIFVFWYANQNVFAAEYVLPYPSFMPGNTFYKVSRLLDSIERWWYWGSISSLKYHLKLADKYLVEAKTLFEYKQYQLGVDALKRSDTQIPLIRESLHSAQQDGKDTQQLKIIVRDAMTAHVQILDRLSQALPETYQWVPEKQSATTLPLLQLLQQAIAERKRL